MTGDAHAIGSTAPADLLHAPDVESALEVEQHGFDFIEERGRYLRPQALFSFWLGSNSYVYYVFIGALLISLGLSLFQAAAALIVGFLGFLFVGYASAGGARSGLPTMTFSRAAFGVHGNRLGVNLRGFASLAVGMLVGLLTINAPGFQGPASEVLFGGDLTWIAPPIAAGIVYWLLAGRELRAEGSEPR